MSVSVHPRENEDPNDLRRRGDASNAVNGFVDKVEIYELAQRIFGDAAKAEAWFNRPNTSMSGQIPRDLLKDSLERAVVRETLEQIDNGIFA